MIRRSSCIRFGRFVVIFENWRIFRTRFAMVICVILNYSVLIVKLQECHTQFNLSDMSRSLF